MQDNRKHVLFSTDGQGRWWRREWAAQCEEKVDLLSRPCQGVAGHSGWHWAYAENGTLEQEVNEVELEKQQSDNDICSESIPPDHRHYISPVEKVQDYHGSHYTDSEVTDLQELARLEAGELAGGESSCRPVA